MDDEEREGCDESDGKRRRESIGVVHRLQRIVHRSLEEEEKGGEEAWFGEGMGGEHVCPTEMDMEDMGGEDEVNKVGETESLCKCPQTRE